MSIPEIIQDFLQGAGYALQGIREFYHTPKLWLYAVIPMLIMIGLYVAICAFAICLLPDWMDNSWGKTVVIILTVAFVLPSASPLYEMFGGLFSEPLISKYEKTAYGYEAKGQIFCTSVNFMFENIAFCINTLVLSGLLFIASLFIPVIGPVLFIAFICYRLALSYMLDVRSLHGITVTELRQRAGENRASVFGFGVMMYLLLLIPFSMLIIFPGLILGGAKLFHNKLQ